MERQRKPHELDKQYAAANYIPVGTVNLTFQLDATKKSYVRVQAKYAVRRNDKTAKGAPLVLDLAPEVKLTSIRIDGRKLAKNEYKRISDTLIIGKVPDQFVIETSDLIDPKNNTTGEGLYAAGEDLMLTQNEPQGFRKLFPYFDMPKVMAPFRTTIIGNKEKYPVMLSNGNLTDSGENKFGNHWKTYDLPFAIPCYLFALVAGKLAVLKDVYTTKSGRVIDLEIYAEEKDIEKCHHAMASLKYAMAYDEEWYGHVFKGHTYRIVATKHFNMGAMENKGLNIFNVKFVLISPETGTDEDHERVEGVIGHEEFHDFTGDDITCVDWRELGTKESITVRRDHLFSECYRGWGLRKVIDSVKLMRSRQFAEDASPRRHAIRPAEIKVPNNMYSVTVYEKGAEVYKLLEDIIGREGFLKGMKLYATRHDGQATRIEDLMCCMEDANDVDLYQFRNWFTQSGTPTVSIDASYCEFSRRLFLEVRQSCTMAPDRTHMEPFDIPFAIGLIGTDGEMRSEILRITKPEQIFVFSKVPHKPSLSLNRNFAPVRVKYAYEEGELAHLMTHDANLFARWDAGQTYGAQVLLKLAEDVKAGRELVLDEAYVGAFGAVLREENIDKNLLAAMMTLPDETTLANMSEVVDPHAIHKAREFAKEELAWTFWRETFDLYHRNRSDFDAVPSFDPKSVAKRSVANAALGYHADNGIGSELIFEQFVKAKGMSDKYTALSLLVHRESDRNFGRYVGSVLRVFYEQFQDDNNAVDKWFAVQSSSSLPGTVERVKELMKHPAFDWKIPNRVRSVFAWFSLDSLQFHTKEGYRLFADFLVEYAPKNDITAARMVEPLTEWKRYVPELQVLMKAELLRLKEELMKVPPENVKTTISKINDSLAQ
ncbi:MAG: aminopeptidase N [Candidatus Paceibacterota bacterium]|nr:aminopeptidase N [Candidatus Paceibacterota bacterium]